MNKQKEPSNVDESIKFKYKKFNVECGIRGQTVRRVETINGEKNFYKYDILSNTILSKSNQETISTVGLRTSMKNFTHKTMPILHGINCIEKNNNYNINSNDDDVKEDGNSNAYDNNDNNNILNDYVCKAGFDCKIYKNVKNNCEYNRSNYNHICSKNHFNFDYSNKPQCKYGSQCNSNLRVARINENPNDFDNHRFDDSCHLCIYRHPPRMYTQRPEHLAFFK